MTVDCTTLVDNLFESELFGHERGAFTGAGDTKKGRLELAGEGTIFFDEIGDLPMPLQSNSCGSSETGSSHTLEARKPFCPKPASLRRPITTWRI